TGGFLTRGVGKSRRRGRPASLTRPQDLLSLGFSKKMCGDSLPPPEEQHPPLFLFPFPPSVPLVGNLHSLEFFGEQIGPAIYTMLLLDVIRSRAGALERARLARELHDGVIQSLVGAEMQVEAWRRHQENKKPFLSSRSIPSTEELEKL